MNLTHKVTTEQTQHHRHSPAFCCAQHNADADQQASCLTYQNWAQRYDQLSAGCFTGVIQEARLPALTLLRETSNRVLLQKGCPPEGIFSIGIMMYPTEHGYHDGGILRPHSAVLLNPQVEFEIRTPERFDLIAAIFEPQTLSASLQDPYLDPQELEHELRHSPRMLNPQHTRKLEDFLLQAFESSQSNPELLFANTNVRQFHEEFYALLLSAVHDHNVPHPAHKGNAGVCRNRERIVRRMRALLEAHPETALDINTLCEEIGVTRRTLHNAVQEVLGVSPQHCLKAIRLNSLRRALKAREVHRESIGDIAARWGFWHLSQLAQDYRKLFGELPSQTQPQTVTQTEWHSPEQKLRQ